MTINNVSLYTSAVDYRGFPDTALPEIAFVGKSNVGKSSLINCMLGRKGLARASKEPGKTRTINFYTVEDALYFVDLPGYGYAKVSKPEKEKWGNMIERYLLNRPQLKVIVFLVDIRHEPSADDKMMLDWLNYYQKTVIVCATKADKLKRSQLDKQAKVVRTGLGVGEVLAFSSETKAGREELWGIIEQHIKK